MEAELASQLSSETYVKLSREFAELGPLVETIKAYRAARAELADLDALMADPATDAEMRAMADGEKPELRGRARRSSSRRSASHLIPKDAMDERNVILEIRAGTGGDEASLFAGDLFRMYERYAAKQGWKVGDDLGERRHDGRLQGNRRGNPRPRRLRQAEIRIRRAPRAARARHRGAGPHSHLGRDRRGAAGGRGGRCRDQRSRPEDRHHARAAAPAASTSTRPKSAIRITHIPSGIVDRGAGGPLAAPQQGQGDGAAARQALRPRAQRSSTPNAPPSARGQVGSGDRSERIRTYNFPQGRVTDHRINLTLYKLPQIIEGEALGEMIDALVTEHQAALLAAQDEHA